MNEQSKFKYIINIEGNSSAYRFSYLLKTGSLILNVVSENKLWWENFTTPYEIQESNENSVLSKDAQQTGGAKRTTKEIATTPPRCVTPQEHR